MTEGHGIARRWRGRPVSVPAGFLEEALEWRRRIKAAVTIEELRALNAPTAAALARKWNVSGPTARKYLSGSLPKRISEDA